ncbi:hypothetical protein [Caldilinea sp.]|uniref:hypothetical protein n=1 Tax=Caldilinea sp. TaxID=2293560 RepID=UPI0021DBCD27|nr:hypothetical protein [Caldilinea sp.]GIV71209.1 MAG: hypothetical protein KatS3mg048_4071 [Caldilinea sp.]
MVKELSRICPVRKSGNESLHLNGHPLGVTLLDFWRWSSSDLVSNTTRGVLAEFIVASALGIKLDSVRDEWGAFDLITPEGITIEVKSAAYIQSWSQRSLSFITFRVPKTRAWNADTNVQEKEPRRQAQVYVFALLAHQDKASIDPLNVDQWRFFVLSTTVLDARTRSQHSITLRSLERLAGQAISYDELREAVRRAVAEKVAG